MDDYLENLVSLERLSNVRRPQSQPIDQLLEESLAKVIDCINRMACNVIWISSQPYQCPFRIFIYFVHILYLPSKLN